jgi:putative oxidoreductase
MSRQIDARLDSYAPTVLSLLRVVCALVLLTHATSHLFGWPKGSAAGIGEWPLWYAGILELVTGALILIGLFTRIASFIASGVMAFAYLSQHAPKSLWPTINNGEPALLLCFAFLLFVFAGAGSVALDARRR